MHGKVISDAGVLLDRPRLQIIKKNLKAEEIIAEHSHPGMACYFVACNGDVVVTLEGEEKHELKKGDVLNYKGDNAMSAVAKEDSTVIIVLAK